MGIDIVNLTTELLHIVFIYKPLACMDINGNVVKLITCVVAEILAYANVAMYAWGLKI